MISNHQIHLQILLYPLDQHVLLQVCVILNFITNLRIHSEETGFFFLHYKMSLEMYSHETISSQLKFTLIRNLLDIYSF